MRRLLEIGGNTSMYILTVMQTKEIFQIVSLVLSIIISIIIIVSKIVEWYKNAKEDGKISKEELKELKDNVKNDVDKLKTDASEIVEILEIQEKEEIINNHYIFTVFIYLEIIFRLLL